MHTKSLKTVFNTLEEHVYIKPQEESVILMETVTLPLWTKVWSQTVLHLCKGGITQVRVKKYLKWAQSSFAM